MIPVTLWDALWPLAIVSRTIDGYRKIDPEARAQHRWLQGPPD
tara:strand:+ start:387 stop:515 length:129 start_codon:yes stop_codon:yes gene_type:complete